LLLFPSTGGGGGPTHPLFARLLAFFLSCGPLSWREARPFRRRTMFFFPQSILLVLNDQDFFSTRRRLSFERHRSWLFFLPLIPCPRRRTTFDPPFLSWRNNDHPFFHSLGFPSSFLAVDIFPRQTSSPRSSTPSREAWTLFSFLSPRVRPSRSFFFSLGLAASSGD